MRTAPEVRALYLQDGPESIFGLLHAPRGASRPDAAVLIIPPFGWEDVCSYRSRRDWAEQLAGAGYPTLRVDLPSTGDSGGSSRDRERLPAWIRAVGSAADWLGATSGARSVVAIGIGLGGLLLCAAIAEGAWIDEIVLWAVPSRGRASVRELRAFERMESAKLAGRRVRGPAPASKGQISAGGFALCAETIDALEGLDLTALAFPPARPRRAMMLERDGIAVEQRLLECLTRTGAVVSVAPGPGYGAMMAEPQEARPPTEVFAQVQNWLQEGVESHLSPPERADRAVLREHQPPLTQPTARAIVRAVDTAELTIDGVRILERPLSVAHPTGLLFGVLAEPAATQVGDLGTLLLNAGAIRRIGPNRMWVEIARRWAARGVPTLRLDLEGLGDADGDATRFADVAELYVPEFVNQVRSAMDALQARGVANRFVLAGLCSGAYWSFHGALQDERVAAAFMLNPRTLFWDASLENIRYLRRGLLKPSSWRMVLHGDVSLGRVGRVARQAPHSLLRRTIARAHARGEGDELELALDRLTSTGTQLVFAFSEEEPLHEELSRQGRLARNERWPNLRLDLLPGSDHTLRPAYSQQRAYDALDRALQHELERVPA
ncbi:MAG: alpha/beta fold hydrolase [Actinomycetota bacterium]|nr:alpha/beta fold hydrolase [Actinomycetota bacterium]